MIFVATTNHVGTAALGCPAERSSAKARTRSADIDCLGYDENMLGIGGWHAQMFGGVRLPVRESETHDAGATLQPSASPENP